MTNTNTISSVLSLFAVDHVVIAAEQKPITEEIYAHYYKLSGPQRDIFGCRRQFWNIKFRLPSIGVCTVSGSSSPIKFEATLACDGAQDRHFILTNKQIIRPFTTDVLIVNDDVIAKIKAVIAHPSELANDILITPGAEAHFIHDLIEKF